MEPNVTNNATGATNASEVGQSLSEANNQSTQMQIAIFMANLQAQVQSKLISSADAVVQKTMR